jgi:hypothetical protein
MADVHAVKDPTEGIQPHPLLVAGAFLVPLLLVGVPLYPDDGFSSLSSAFPEWRTAPWWLPGSILVFAFVATHSVLTGRVLTAWEGGPKAWWAQRRRPYPKRRPIDVLEFPFLYSTLVPFVVAVALAWLYSVLTTGGSIAIAARPPWLRVSALIVLGAAGGCMSAVAGSELALAFLLVGSIRRWREQEKEPGMTASDAVQVAIDELSTPWSSTPRGVSVKQRRQRVDRLLDRVKFLSTAGVTDKGVRALHKPVGENIDLLRFVLSFDDAQEPVRTALTHAQPKIRSESWPDAVPYLKDAVRVTRARQRKKDANSSRVNNDDRVLTFGFVTLLIAALATTVWLYLRAPGTTSNGGVFASSVPTLGLIGITLGIGVAACGALTVATKGRPALSRFFKDLGKQLSRLKLGSGKAESKSDEPGRGT